MFGADREEVAKEGNLDWSGNRDWVGNIVGTKASNAGASSSL